MNAQALPFLIAAFFGLVVWGLVVRRYLWPWAKSKDLPTAAEPLLYLHAFRFIGLGFIAPGVADAGLNPAWSHPAAWGDLGSAVLALICLALRSHRVFPLVLWLFNLWGLFDLLRAAALGPVYDVPPLLHATFFIPVLGVPLLFWTHIVLFALLTRRSPDAVLERYGSAEVSPSAAHLSS